MAIYISVVSHEHSKLINSLSCLEKLTDDFFVVVKSNTPGDDFNKLNKKNNFYWINESYYRGFGENNNIIFSYCQKTLKMKNDDFFIVLNPDVIIEQSSLVYLTQLMNRDQVSLAAINLFKNNEKTESDNSIRKFPSLWQFVSSFIGLGNKSIIDKSQIDKPMNVDWSAGSFLAFEATHYGLLRGFDENYFMYCEDIDICYRSYKNNEKLVYYPSVTAIHLAKHANRKLLSKHFYWHVKSVFRFLFSKKGFTKQKSGI